MNWIDIVFLVVLAVGAIIGLRTGLIGAAVIAVGVLIGWFLAGRVSPAIGGIYDRVETIDTIVTTVFYVVIMIVAGMVAGNVAKIVRAMSAVATLGISTMVDRIGGAALGLLVGFIIASALLLALARATYDTELPDEGAAGAVVSNLPEIVETRTAIEDSLTGSFVAPAVVRVYTHLPASGLGFVPEDFMVSLETLESRIEEEQ